MKLTPTNPDLTDADRAKLATLSRAQRRQMEKRYDSEMARLKREAQVKQLRNPVVKLTRGYMSVVEKPKPWWMRLMFWRKK